MANEELAGNPPEQIAPSETGEQGAGTGTPEQATGQPEKYVSAGEFGRRFGKLETQLQTMMSYIAAQQAAVQRPQVQQPTSSQLTDEELWNLAQQGDRDAFVKHQERISQRVYQQQQQTTGRQNLVEVQLTALAQKYPVLNDSSHPLTQKAQTAYQLLVNAGYPANRATLLEAAKTAIADSPDLIAEEYGKGSVAREHARQSGVRTAQSGVTSVTYRQEPARQGNVRDLTQEEIALARRMGVKDPKGAKERFIKRQESKQSAVSHTLLPVLEQEMERF